VRTFVIVMARMNAMDSEMIGQAQADKEIILTFDVSDEALERTVSAEQQAYTWIYCTGAWQYCPAYPLDLRMRSSARRLGDGAVRA
jgi:hypothetical protein